jgi:hypothetical protein
VCKGLVHIVKCKFKVVHIRNIKLFLGYSWMESLGNFSMNLKMNYLLFWHMLHDFVIWKMKTIGAK